MAPPKVEPILLYAFCFNIQKEQRFNQSWACAFHTSWYSDESHSMWESVDDPNKRREIRYGNNIYVLFRALLHCRKFYGQDSFWVAISRGFNTSATIVRVTVEILTEARRAQRDKPSRDVPDTARAADDWIDFLDSQGSHPRVLPDPEIHGAAEAFFKTQEKKYVNAAKVPVSGHLPPLYDSRFDTRHGGLPSPSIKPEDPREADRQWSPRFGRKRSASPPRGPSSKSRRLEHDAHRQPRPEPDRHGALDELPKIQTTRSPPRPGPSRPAQPPPRLTLATRGDEGSNSLPATPRAQLPPKLSVTTQKEAASGGSTPTRPAPSPAIVHDDSALKARIASLEKELAEAHARSRSSVLLAKPAPETAAPASQLGKDMTELKKEMATATGAISTMMESMHYIVDNLSSVQEEISGLTTEQQTLTAALPQLSSSSSSNPTTEAPNLNTLLTPLQTLLTAVTALQADVTHLKTNPPPPPPPAQQPQPDSTRHLEALLQAQTARLDKLSHQLATIQHHQHHPPTTTAPANQQQQQPQTLRQAMAAAERDLQHHLNRVQAFYHRGSGGGGSSSSSMGSGNGGSGSGSGSGLGGGLGGAGAGAPPLSRAATERTADLLAVLADGVRAAKAGQAGF